MIGSRARVGEQVHSVTLVRVRQVNRTVTVELAKRTLDHGDRAETIRGISDHRLDRDGDRQTHSSQEDIAMTSAVLVLALGLTGQSPQGPYAAAQGPGKVLPAAQAPGKVSPAAQAPGKVLPAAVAPAKFRPAAQAPGKAHAGGGCSLQGFARAAGARQGLAGGCCPEQSFARCPGAGQGDAGRSGPWQDLAGSVGP